MHVFVYMGGDTRGAGGALAPPLYEEGGLSPPTFHAALHSSRSDATQPAMPIRSGLNCACVFFASPIAFPTHICTRALIMAKRQASLAELCGPRKKGRDSSEM